MHSLCASLSGRALHSRAPLALARRIGRAAALTSASSSTQPRTDHENPSASALPYNTATTAPVNARNQRERELILSVLSTVPSQREARKFLNSVSGSETMKSQREFEERQAQLAVEQPIGRSTSQGGMMHGEILWHKHRLNIERQCSAAAAAGEEEHVPRKLTAAVFVDGLEDEIACERAGKLLAQIQRLGVTPVVLVSGTSISAQHSSTAPGTSIEPEDGYRGVIKRVHKLADAIEKEGGKARPINEGVFYSNPYTKSEISVDPELIGSAVAQNQVPIIAPLVADSSLRLQVLNMSSSATALASALASSTSSYMPMAGTKGEFSLLLARLIYLGKNNGISSGEGAFQRFVNLEEDYSEIADSCKQSDTLQLMRVCLGIFPPTAAGIVASVYSDPSLVMKGLISERPVSTQHLNAAHKALGKASSAENSGKRALDEHGRPSYKPLANYPFVNVGAGNSRRAPAFAESSKVAANVEPTQFTLLRHGFRIQRHTSLDTCDLPRLRALLESSFKRTLDGSRYFDRLRERASDGGIQIIVAGDYQGAVIVTHEPIPRSSTSSAAGRSCIEHLPYLDKFAVAPSVQGTGMADILWAQLRRACANCLWRSRNDNGVNKWYFDRSSGHSRSRPLGENEKGTRWVFFWYQSQSQAHRPLTMDEIQAGIGVARRIPASFV
ncbi:DUF619-domain-containing protein [Martensiomyces pterosporus]|nr:DUF619-domain-containing protein [Martensiomyces pterosporus]